MQKWNYIRNCTLSKAAVKAVMSIKRSQATRAKVNKHRRESIARHVLWHTFAKAHHDDTIPMCMYAWFLFHSVNPIPPNTVATEAKSGDCDLICTKELTLMNNLGIMHHVSFELLTVKSHKTYRSIMFNNQLDALKEQIPFAEWWNCWSHIETHFWRLATVSDICTQSVDLVDTKLKWCAPY